MLRRVAVRVPIAEAESARAKFVEFAPSGFEEVDGRDWLELAAYTDARGEGELRAAFADVTVSEVAADWQEHWRAFHRPVEVAGLWVGPPWVTVPAGSPSVIIDPGRAFGTGAHPTTRACIELLARGEPASVFDAGCGSGVLAIAAARLGYGPVRAVDADPVAVEATRANAARNGVEVEVTVGDVLKDDPPAADVLVANIELRAIETLLGRWSGRRAIVSGYFAHERPSSEGWTGAERVELEGWAADSLARTV